MMTHWDFLLYVAVGMVLGGIKGRHETKRLLAGRLRFALWIGLGAGIAGLSILKLGPATWETAGPIFVNAMAGLAALWFSFSWARWFFGPIRWN